MFDLKLGLFFHQNFYFSLTVRPLEHEIREVDDDGVEHVGKEETNNGNLSRLNFFSLAAAAIRRLQNLSSQDSYLLSTVALAANSK